MQPARESSEVGQRHGLQIVFRVIHMIRSGLSIYLSVYLSIYLSIYLIYLSICLSIYLSIDFSLGRPNPKWVETDR